MNKYNLLVNRKSDNAQFFAFKENNHVHISNGSTLLSKYFTEKYDVLKIFSENNYDHLIEAWKHLCRNKSPKERSHIFITNPNTYCKILVRLDDVRFKNEIRKAINEKVNGGYYV